MTDGHDDPVRTAIATLRALEDPIGLLRQSDQRETTASRASGPTARQESRQPGLRIAEARGKAFLKLLRYAENRSETDDPSVYSRMFGGGTIASLDKHPPPQQVMVNRHAIISSMAGAYQISLDTWNEAVSHLAAHGVSVRDFSPASQDLVAAQIISDAHASDLIQQGDVEDALARDDRRRNRPEV
jgi:lysozyme